ncbi:response regulator [Hassallia byssoidea VB512170]|uniref:Circadian input-output histidine kinase CikA n=1 Tax=Hassallia byssoidea VB512170 TaxID=1304833 RepID=A0A846HIG9_9CYAN|nr:ATP-binding protein [Hassalia byssoidea]NEU77155.1 response regulator [Hassalia byssoidea VB512170]
MSELWTNFFTSSPFIPHGHCYLWKTNLVGLHLLSDAFIALAYFSIPITLFWFVRQRRDLPFDWIFLLFAAFIVACGTTHLMQIWTLWYPTYWLSGAIKAVTAMVSVFTALQLVPLVPQALALPSPAQLEQANQQLQIQIKERLRVELELRKYQDNLEQLVAQRTNELIQTNAQLQQEIVERQHTEAALRQSQETIRQQLTEIEAIYTNAPIGLGMLDINFRYIRVNKQLAQINGIPESEHLGRTVHEVLPELGNVQKPVFEEIIATRLPVLNHELQGETPAQPGIERSWVVSYYPLQDGDRQVASINIIVQEITERKRAEQEREALYTREQSARQQAETANRVKDQFLAVLSHELRTPLNPILGWAKLLQTRSFDSATIVKGLTTIERNAKLQIQLIDDLLDVSRILRNKLILEISSVDLSAVIAAALETVRWAAETKAMQIQLQIDPNVNFVYGDFNRLHQVIGNLLSNAVKFTPSGGQIEVSLRQNGSCVQINVSDTGKGISPDFLPHVFEYFQQADSSTTRQFGGLGLGLAIVRNLVDLHGGSVTVESPGEDKGATFSVKLPLVPASLVLPENSSTKSSTLPNLVGVKIFIVEDDDDSREFLCILLRKSGAIVTAAASALEALSNFTNSQPNILLCDIGMPEMDGYSFMRQIRTMSPEQGGNIPAIALTAYAGETDKQQVLAAGFTKHVAKPVVVNELIASIAELVKS